MMRRTIPAAVVDHLAAAPEQALALTDLARLRPKAQRLCCRHIEFEIGSEAGMDNIFYLQRNESQ